MGTYISQGNTCSDHIRDSFYWCGRVSAQSSPWHRAILTLFDGKLHICLLDTQKSYTATVDLNLDSNRELFNPTVAQVNDKTKFAALVITALRSSSDNNVLVRVNELEHNQKVLYISVKWGVEYLQYSAIVDILAIRLNTSLDSSIFLRTIFDNLDVVQNRINEIIQYRYNIDSEIEDLSEAQKRVDHPHLCPHNRLQFFLQELNFFKQN